MILTIKNVRPMFNHLVTTMDKYEDDKKVNGVYIERRSGVVKEYQRVVAVGPLVKGIEVGDTVFINPKRYAVVQHKEGSLKDGVIKDNPVVSYKFDKVEIEGVEHLLLTDSDIRFVADIEEFDENPTIVTEDKILS